MREGDREILARARDVETQRGSDPSFLGWDWSDVRAAPQSLNRLVLEGLVRVAFKSRSSTNYLLTPEGRALAESHEDGPVQADEVPGDLFQTIVGYDDVKEALRMVALGGRQVNILLTGPPGTAKTILLMEMARLPGTYTATGSRVTSAGLTEALEEYRPRILLLDELEKMDMKAMSVLLSVMESGLVTVTKHQDHRSFQVSTSVVGACNNSSRLPPEFRSRFGFHLRFQPYIREEFYEVCTRYLSDREGVSLDVARHIAEVVWEKLSHDVRVARSIARMLKSPTVEEVDRWAGFLRRYS